LISLDALPLANANLLCAESIYNQDNFIHLLICESAALIEAYSFYANQMTTSAMLIHRSISGNITSDGTM